MTTAEFFADHSLLYQSFINCPHHNTINACKYCYMHDKGTGCIHPLWVRTHNRDTLPYIITNPKYREALHYLQTHCPELFI